MTFYECLRVFVLCFMYFNSILIGFEKYNLTCPRINYDEFNFKKKIILKIKTLI